MILFKRSSWMIASLIFLCGGAQSAIHLNQEGYYPGEKKIAIITTASSDSFFVVNNSGSIIFSGKLLDGGNWNASEENTKIADFSLFKETGEFKIRVKGQSDSYTFKIGENVFETLSKASIKAFYFNRASMALDQQYAGQWTRAAGHSDNQVTIHPSAASSVRAKGTKISSPGGWYDAGDYGKYIVNSGISTYTLLSAYSAFSVYYDTLKLNIPESSNNLPDLIDEILWNLRWMLTMQDPNDGGVYHKLTTANFCNDNVMPEDDNLERFIIQKSTAATLDFAAVAAQAYRVLGKKLPALADSCLNASLKAWAWARTNRDSFYTQDSVFQATYSPVISTGSYADRNVSDEFKWAAVELYISTKQDSFYNIAYPSGLDSSYEIPGWGNVKTLGLYSLFLSRDSLSPVADRNSIFKKICILADTFSNRYEKNPYRTSMIKSDFYWGSNSVAGNQGIAMLIGYLATGKKAYKDGALGTLDYLLGKNPNAYCFVTGIGDKQVMNIHHRPSIADDEQQPVPGFLAGGPNEGQQEYPDCQRWNGCPKYPFAKGTKVAMSYVDEQSSYASNEVAINWNAPLVFLSGALEALQHVIITDTKKPALIHRNHSAPLLHQRCGSFSVEMQKGLTANITVTDLRGKVLRKIRVGKKSKVTVNADWSAQMVIVLIDTEAHTGEKFHYSYKLPFAN